MAKVKITGHASGSGVITVTAPNTSTDRTITLPDSTGTLLDSTSTLDATKVSGTHTSFASTGIDDNANATAITIDSNKGVGIKNTNSDSFVYKGLVVGDGGSSDQGVNIYSSAWGALTFADATSGNGRYEGSIAYNHAENRMAIATNHATAMNIDSTGAVTMPNQPAFSATMSSALTNFSLSTAHKLPFNNEIFDNNSDFNTSTNTFTAPVTGKYQLNTFVRVDNMDTGAGYYHLYFYTSNRYYFDIITPHFTSDVTYQSMQVSMLADMDANDTAFVSIFQSGGAVQSDISAEADSHFSGYLAC